MHTRNSIALLGSYVLLVAAVFEGVRAVNIDNVDRLEPVVRRSMDTSEPGDQFGFSVVMHQMEVVNNGDTRAQAAAKTRLVLVVMQGKAG